MRGRIHKALRPGLLALAGMIGLAGCGLTPWRAKAPPPPPPPPPPAPVVPVLPAGVATHRFELEDGQDVVGAVQSVIASKEDTLPDIARRFNVGYQEIVRSNPGVDPWLPGAGRRIVVPSQFVLPNAPREGVIINIPAMRIFYFPKRKKGEPPVVYTHPIGVGKVGWTTPEGVTRIVGREENPTWRPSAAVRKEHAANDDPVDKVVPPGPDNPLGKYKFSLAWPSYLIHGTNKPYGVGLRSSHGCIRLYPEDIARFYAMIPIGTQVRVVNQPYLFGWQDGQLVVQAYGALDDDKRDWKKSTRVLMTRQLTPAAQKGVKSNHLEINWAAVAQEMEAPVGLVVPLDGHSDGASVAASGPLVQNRIPPGANWDGADDIERDEQSYQQLLAERERKAAGG